MRELYLLKHKNVKCGVIVIDTADGKLEDYRSSSVAEGPFLGNDQKPLMKKWWSARCVPGTRKAIQEILRQAGCETSGEYLARNLALSMTDCYWICPIEADLRWENVDLRKTGIRIGGRIPYHNATSYDPNASLGGQMEKYWDLTGDVPVLVKTAGMYYGQQALNELFASTLHRAQKAPFPYVEYTVRKTENDDLQALCRSFTSENREFIPAMDVLDSEKIKGDESLYDAYIRICSAHGIDREYMQDYMDYQTLSDFVISNTDEHLLNFGILRDPDTLLFTGTAPIFDSGNSMFYADTGRIPLERSALLARRITSFHDSEEAMLRHVRNRMILREDLLPSRTEVLDLYTAGGVPEEKALYIALNYETKAAMLKEFQKGITISVYHEKHRS